MPAIPEMDELVNWDSWDNAAPVPASVGSSDFMSGQDTTSSPLKDLHLALENVDGDDFSFWALEHFEATNPAAAPAALALGEAGQQLQTFEGYLETPEAPCAHCLHGGFSCKRINEGKFKGYCTSCVALACECSFGLAAQGTTPSAAFPANPWPVHGDHPKVIPQEDIHPELLQRTSAPDLMATISTASQDEINLKTSGPKIGARFSRDSVKILKNWLSTHARHPYPTEEQKEMLQKQTGLNKTQITNWLANARRRGKIVAPRSTSPGVRSFSNAIDIPQRRGTPSPLEHMIPLDRWRNSPPEHEPASVTDIARAIASSNTPLSSSGLDSPFSGNVTDDGSNRSLWAGSSASSVRTSHSSGGSFASAFSHASRGSLGSFGSMSINRGRRRRRRKAAPKVAGEKTSLITPLKTFQCTFCTETFRTKHDWQRHEKSLHLSLERWVCAPDGPRALNPDNNRVSCVFCGEADPDDAHVESHNHSACQERSLEERTFYRKDHLRQHLKLVHGVKFTVWSMEPWKVATPEIRSRCGFCGIVMDTWSIRVDHLAEHFKTGKTMADWTGDWGFELPVLEMVENSIPPYLIHDERNSPFPYEATKATPDSPRTAYELLRCELMFYLWNFQDVSNGRMPTDDQLQVEACRIIYGADVLSKKSQSSASSWLRDLLLSSEQLARQAKLAPIRRQNESRLYALKINGKDNIFEDDSMERQLHDYVKARNGLGLTSLDTELQVEACNILGRIEESSSEASDDVANFLLRLILRSTDWLAEFRQRAHLPRSDDIMDVNLRSKDPTTIDSTIHNYSRLEAELADFVKARGRIGVIPSDDDLQRQARVIIYEFDDSWNQTAADNVDWLNGFKRRHLHGLAPATGVNAPLPPTSTSLDTLHRSSTASSSTALTSTTSATTPATSTTGYFCPFPQRASRGMLYVNDANCYHRLARELTRWVASTMSPNNPNRHVPSDEELQHQGRWIIYDSDDTWNQTPADNAEWLRRFKKDTGIITDESVPGLPDGQAWNISQGGSGFAPPYTIPEQNPTSATVLSLPQTDRFALPVQNGAKTFMVQRSTADKYLQSLAQGRLPQPAVVFCSRELENGLVDFVADATAPLGLGNFPSDQELRAKARDILGSQSTPADDPVLLGKFKDMVRDKLALGMGAEIQPSTAAAGQQFVRTAGTTSSVGGGVADGLAGLPLDMDTGLTDSQLTDILQDMDFEFGDVTGLDDAVLGAGFDMDL